MPIQQSFESYLTSQSRVPAGAVPSSARSRMKTHIRRFRRFLVLTATAGWLILSLSAAALQDTNQPRRPVLVGRDGAVLRRYGPTTTPEEIGADLDAHLA